MATKVEDWIRESIPRLDGRLVVVTGANSGIGYEAARLLASQGARVVLGCRDRGRAEAAAGEIRKRCPGAALEARELDLARLDSVERFAEEVARDHTRLDALVNNAGVMALPYRETADGFEMQFGVNHLGHFALTGLLLERLLATPHARVVTVSSLMHHFGTTRFESTKGGVGYWRWAAYADSKLANLLFSNELQRRLTANRAGILAVACHPGYAATNLQKRGGGDGGASPFERFTHLHSRMFAQSAEMGALPTLYAAAARAVGGGDFIGPDGPFEAWGFPGRARQSPQARSPALAARLWRRSEQLTGIRYPLPEGSG